MFKNIRANFLDFSMTDFWTMKLFSVILIQIVYINLSNIISIIIDLDCFKNNTLYYIS